MKWFGASGAGKYHDWHYIQNAIDNVISHPKLPRTLYYPEGSYNICQPLILSNFINNGYNMFNINLKGASPSKAAVSSYTSTIIAMFNNKFAIGLQTARTCIMENLTIIGQFSFPFSLSSMQI